MTVLAVKARRARALIMTGHADLAVPLVDALIEANDYRGYFLKALMYRRGGCRFPADPARALEAYRDLASRFPGDDTALNLARALLDAGGESRSEAFDLLERVAGRSNPPETELGFGLYHERADPPNFDAAARHYRKAFWRGRCGGLANIARLQLLNGHPGRSLLTLACVSLAFPLVFLLIGSKARRTF